MSKRAICAGLVALGVAFGGVGLAQEQATPGPGAECPQAMGPGMMGPGMMGRHGMMRGPGMMGGGMGCPLMAPGRDVKVKVEKRDDGVTITMTSSDPKVVAMMQKRAQIMQLMHELQQEELQD